MDNDEIIAESKLMWIISADEATFKDKLNKMLNEARADMLDKVQMKVSSKAFMDSLLTYIPRKLKTKEEERISREGYEHGIKTAVEAVLSSIDYELIK